MNRPLPASMWVGILILVFFGAFFSGNYIGWSNRAGEVTRYAGTPDGCAHWGMVHDGWVNSPKYNGGIENGGITGANEYSCSWGKK